MRFYIKYLFFTAIINVVNVSGAQPGGPANEALSGNMGWALIKTLMALSFVIGLVIALTWAFKRFAGQKRYKGETLIRVAGVSHLGAKKCIYLVDVADKRLVLGVTEQSIHYLTEIEKVEEIADVAIVSEMPPRSFRQFMDGLMRPGAKHE
ncbi:flagellar biosynthetic protein FliO [bacterium]|nr:flagellar biosynthetic protein FliO [bacterium]